MTAVDRADNAGGTLIQSACNGGAFRRHGMRYSSKLRTDERRLVVHGQLKPYGTREVDTAQRILLDIADHDGEETALQHDRLSFFEQQCPRGRAVIQSDQQLIPSIGIGSAVDPTQQTLIADGGYGRLTLCGGRFYNSEHNAQPRKDEHHSKA